MAAQLPDGQVTQASATDALPEGSVEVVVSASVTSAPGAGAVTLTGLAPTVIQTANVVATPGAGAIVTAGLAPIAQESGNTVATPANGAVVLAGLAPTGVQTANVLSLPAAGAVVVTGATPTAAVDTPVPVGVGAVVLSGKLPTRTVSAAGTLTTPPIKNNTGVLLANETGVVVNVYDQTTGALVLHKTGQTTDASGICTVIDLLLVVGTTYAYEVVLSSNGRRLPTAAAT